jgi:RND superfamily putative drug exporter
MTTRGPIATTARWSAHHPWWAIAAWIAVVAVAFVGGQSLGTMSLTEGQEGNGESARADRALEASGLGNPIRESVLIRRRDGAPVRDADLAAGNAIGSAVDELPAVGTIDAPVVSEDRSAALVSWTIASEESAQLDRMEAAVASVAATRPDLRLDQVGDLTIEAAVEDAVDDDLVTAEKLSIPITLIILLAAFGALIAALIPLVMALSCVVMAVGLTAVASHITPVSEAINSVILLIGLAVGVDYSMFVLRRAREERARGVAARDAVDIASETAGRAVVVSGLTVLVAMAGMFLSGNGVFTSFAIGTMIVVATAIIGSITVLPALAARLGTAIDRPRIPFLHRLSNAGRESRLWNAVLRPVLRRPGVAMALAAGALVALALPASNMTTKLLGSEDIPRSIPVMQTYDALTRAFPSEGDAHVVVLQGKDIRSGAAVTATAQLEQRLRNNPNFAIQGPLEVRASTDRRVAEVVVPYPGPDDGRAAKDGLSQLRDTLLPETYPSEIAVASVTGSTAGNRDFSDRLAQRLPYVVGFVLGLTFVLMLVSFRSVPIAAVTVMLNLLSVAAAYGLLVLVFQNTWAEGLLDFTSNGSIVSWLPLFLFVVLFGLSMDYHVFVLSRIREAFDSGLDSREAIRHGVTSSAGVVTSAAVVMVAVFAVFATLTPLDFKQMGVGLAAAVLLDATVVRGVLLPAALQLLGDRAWHMPRWLHWLPQGATEQPAPGTAASVPALDASAR